MYEDVDWMRDAYVTRRLSLRQVASEAQCSLRTVARWMAIHGIATRADALPPPRFGADHPSWKGGPPTCSECGTPISWTSARCMNCRDFLGEQNPKWRGDQIMNPAMHGRVKALRGQASTHACAHCGGSAKDWAYDHTDPAEHADPEGPFSLDPTKYLPLCAKCHKRFDLAYLAAKL